MVDDIPPRDDERFEEVLGRLDLLIRRNQSQSSPLPPPAVSEATIPVLTEEFVPEVPYQKPLTEEETAEALMERLVEAVMPVMMHALDDVLSQVIGEIRPKTEALLRQRIQQTLSHKFEN